MKKIVLSLSLVAGATIFAQTAKQTSLSIYFEKDSYDLSDASMQLLDSLRASVRDPAEELLLVGHTDSDASVAYNKELSLSRTRAVQNYLYDHDFHNRIHIDWKGEAKPVNGNINETEKTLNRRVEVVRNYKDPNNFVERFKKPAETFVINPNRDTLIVGKEGTKIFIPAGSFRTKDPNAPIELKLTEFYKMSDFVLNDLSTTTTINELLESGGTINIEAFSGNEKLELDDLATIEVSFKNRQEDDEMQAFYGYEGESVTKWSTQEPPSSTSMDSILLSKAFKMRNLDTMEIITEQLKSIDGVVYKVVTTQRRGHPLNDFVTETRIEEMNPDELVNSILFSKDRTITEKIKPGPNLTNVTWRLRRVGLINCDRYWEQVPRTKPGEPPAAVVMQTLNLEIQNQEVPSVSVILEATNTVIPYSKRENNVFIFDNVPVGQDFEVIAIFADNRGVMMGQLKGQQLKNDPNSNLGNVPLKMKPCTENEVRMAVQEMDDRRSN